MTLRLLIIPFLFGSVLAIASPSVPDTTLPDSDIDIPIQLDLRPVYAMAEKNVGMEFTSPHYPDEWVQADCSTRYKYHFRRSPLRMTMQGNKLDLSFTGFYQIVGSTRLCNGTTTLSPWTPACRCGFDEPERKVAIGYSARFALYPNYLLHTTISGGVPVAQDKCEVCFWGQDVTPAVLGGLKTELDASRKAMQDSFGVINLKPYMQWAWAMLNASYPVPGIGFFQLHPKKLRMQNISADKNILSINLGITAAPAISITSQTAGATTVVPDLSNGGKAGAFSVYLEAALPYDSLSTLMNASLAGKRFDLSEGLFAKHIEIKQVTVAGNAEGSLLIKLDFTGSFNGTAFFTGKPFYNAATKTIEVSDLDYDLQTKNILLNSAKWLFNKKIAAELKKHTSFPMAAYYQTATVQLNTYLNKEWTKGIKGSGNITDLNVVEAHALPEHLLLKTACHGYLKIAVSSLGVTL